LKIFLSQSYKSFLKHPLMATLRYRRL
jgi:hypothetical protein